jgi:hypothetical protein
VEMTVQEAQDVIDVLAQELNAARQNAISVKIQLARVQRELARCSAIIAEQRTEKTEE